MLLDAGRERWARAAGPGPWPARLALFAAVLAPFASDGVWAPPLRVADGIMLYSGESLVAGLFAA